jgi:DNA repair exonuclease SbcCD ATPase subunit
MAERRDLDALNGLVGRIGAAITAKNANVTNFKTQLRDRVTNLNRATEAILVRLRGLAVIGEDFRAQIARQTAEIADLNTRLTAATNAQAASATRITELTRELEDARRAGARVAELERDILAAQEQANILGEQVNELTRGIQTANREIQLAIDALQAPLEDPDLARMLNELEGQIAGINTEIGRIAPAVPPQPPPQPTRRGGRKTIRKFKKMRRTRRIRGHSNK